VIIVAHSLDLLNSHSIGFAHIGRAPSRCIVIISLSEDEVPELPKDAADVLHPDHLHSPRCQEAQSTALCRNVQCLGLLAGRCHPKNHSGLSMLHWSH
jgi:hypothetical protein